MWQATPGPETVTFRVLHKKRVLSLEGLYLCPWPQDEIRNGCAKNVLSEFYLAESVWSPVHGFLFDATGVHWSSGVDALLIQSQAPSGQISWATNQDE